MVLRSGVEVPHPPPARHSGPLRESLSKYKYDFQLLYQGWYSLAANLAPCYAGVVRGGRSGATHGDIYARPEVANDETTADKATVA